MPNGNLQGVPPGARLTFGQLIDKVVTDAVSGQGTWKARQDLHDRRARDAELERQWLAKPFSERVTLIEKELITREDIGDRPASKYGDAIDRELSRVAEHYRGNADAPRHYYDAMSDDQQRLLGIAVTYGYVSEAHNYAARPRELAMEREATRLLAELGPDREAHLKAWASLPPEVQSEYVGHYEGGTLPGNHPFSRHAYDGLLDSIRNEGGGNEYAFADPQNPSFGDNIERAEDAAIARNQQKIAETTLARDPSYGRFLSEAEVWALRDERNALQSVPSKIDQVAAIDTALENHARANLQLAYEAFEIKWARMSENNPSTAALRVLIEERSKAEALIPYRDLVEARPTNKADLSNADIAAALASAKTAMVPLGEARSAEITRSVALTVNRYDNGDLPMRVEILASDLSAGLDGKGRAFSFAENGNGPPELGGAGMEERDGRGFPSAANDKGPQMGKLPAPGREYDSIIETWQSMNEDQRKNYEPDLSGKLLGWEVRTVQAWAALPAEIRATHSPTPDRVLAGEALDQGRDYRPMAQHFAALEFQNPDRSPLDRVAEARAYHQILADYKRLSPEERKTFDPTWNPYALKDWQANTLAAWHMLKPETRATHAPSPGEVLVGQHRDQGKDFNLVSEDAARREFETSNSERASTRWEFMKPSERAAIVVQYGHDAGARDRVFENQVANYDWSKEAPALAAQWERLPPDQQRRELEAYKDALSTPRHPYEHHIRADFAAELKGLAEAGPQFPGVANVRELKAGNAVSHEVGGQAAHSPQAPAQSNVTALNPVAARALEKMTRALGPTLDQAVKAPQARERGPSSPELGG